MTIKKLSKNIQFLLPVHQKASSKKYFWPWLSIRKSPGKGFGLFANITLDPGIAFVYFGQLSLAKDFDVDFLNKNTDYCIVSSKNVIINGDPRLDRYNLCLMARVNEASPNEEYNCSFRFIKNCSYMALIVDKKILPNQELFAYYGGSYIRNYKIQRKNKYYNYKNFPTYISLNLNDSCQLKSINDFIRLEKKKKTDKKKEKKKM